MELKEYDVISSGTCAAEALLIRSPLSFWGGVDIKTGRIIDVYHQDYDACMSGKILCFPYDRGSCSGSGVMLEMMRLGTAPAGILCIEAEPVLALAPLIGKKLYGRELPIRTISEEEYKKIPCSGCRISFMEDSILISK